MARCSEDLRVKVVEFIKKGHTHKEAAEIFGVCMKSIYIWNKMDKEGEEAGIWVCSEESASN